VLKKEIKQSYRCNIDLCIPWLNVPLRLLICLVNTQSNTYTLVILSTEPLSWWIRFREGGKVVVFLWVFM